MALRAGVPLIAVLAVGLATRAAWMPFVEGDAGMYGALVILLAVVLAGLPIAFRSDGGRFGLSLGHKRAPLLALPQTMVNGTSNFVLLAVPFFIFAGLIMERGGISIRLVQLVHALVGHWRGGLLQVMVGSMYLVSGLSGAKVADVAAVGTVMREMLQKRTHLRCRRRRGARRIGCDGRNGTTLDRHIGAWVDHQPLDRRTVHRRPGSGRGHRAVPDAADPGARAQE